ncbi:MAG: Yip1 family protein [Dethiobacteraceae bacterium]
MTDEKNIPPSFPTEYFVPGTEEPPDAVEEKQRLKWWQIFWGMICRPGRTFRSTQGRAGLLAPVLMIFGGTTFTTLMVSVGRQEEMAAMMYKELAGAGMSPAEIENIVGMATSPWALALGVAGAVAMILLVWVVQSGILHLAVRVLGGEGVFRQAFEIVGWAWVALFIGSLVNSGYILVTGNMSLPQGDGLGQAFLTNTDLFVVWNMVILVFGFATVYGVRKWKAAVPVVGLWLATVLITYAVGFLGSDIGSGNVS